MTIRLLLEFLSAQTWRRLPLSYERGLPLSEQAITDFLLLDLDLAQDLVGEELRVRTLKATSVTEPQKGCDWEWWIGGDDRGWLRFAIQAKKLSRDGKYRTLRHRVNGKLQLDILEDYASRNAAVPLYCLYNFPDGSPLDPAWHCNQPLAADQLGCTLVPSSRVRAALEAKQLRFSFLHADPEALPWRCLMCPKVLSVLEAPGEMARFVGAAGAHWLTADLPNFRPTLPQGLRAALETGSLEVFPQDAYWQGPRRKLPKRVVVADFGASENAPVPQDIGPPNINPRNTKRVRRM